MENYIVGVSAWGAIAAGVVIVIVSQLLLSLLGLSLGLIQVNPKEERLPSGKTLGIGAGAWWGISSLLSLFIGGWVTGHMSGDVGSFNATMNAVLTWAIASLIGMMFVATGIGSIVGGALGMVINGIKSAGTAATGAAAAAAGSAGAQAPQAGDRLRQQWPQLKQEFESLLRQTGKSELQPEQMKTSAESARRQTTQAAQQPQDIDTMFRQIMQQAGGSTQAVDKNAVVNVLEKRQHMSREQAEHTADQWISTYRKTVSQTRETVKQASDKTEKVAKESAHTLGLAAFWSFVILILGAIAAGLGGAAGAIR